MITTWKFWRATFIRAGWTFSQAFGAAVPVTALSLGQVDWSITASTAGLAAVISVVKSIGAVPPEVEDIDTPGKHAAPDTA